MNADDSRIENYLDELLRRTRSDASTTRRLLNDATEHLNTVADELERRGLSRVQAEAEAVRRFGPAAPIARATSRRSLTGLVIEVARAAVFLGACGLTAVGVSGLVALVMNVALGRSFVGGANLFSGGGTGPSAAEVADDAVFLRVIAGVVGLIVLLGSWRGDEPTRHRESCPRDWSTPWAQRPSPPQPSPSQPSRPTRPTRPEPQASASH